jgi:DNA invertase Pin-like site-specific DNA recombinase
MITVEKNGEKVGYARISDESQNLARQEVLMKHLRTNRIFVDVQSGKNAERPQLKLMLDYVRAGDIVVVESISRLARNTRDLLRIVDILKDKGVAFESQKEKIDTSTPAGEFMLTVFGAIAQLEREFLLARQAEGIAVAKAQGKYKGRQPVITNKKEFESIFKQWKSGGITAVRAMKLLDLSKATFYRRVKEYEGGNFEHFK